MLGGDLPHRNRDPNPVEAGLPLWVNPQVGVHAAIAWGADCHRRFGALGYAHQGPPQKRLRLSPEAVQRPILQQVLESGSLAVGPIAVGEINPQHRRADRHHLRRRHQDTQVSREGFVTGGSTQQAAEIQPRGHGVG